LYCDNYETADRAFHAAGRLLDGYPALSIEQGRLLQHRAGLEATRRRPDLSKQLIQQARLLAEQTQDRASLLRLEMLSGVVNVYQGQYGEARKIYENLAHQVSELDDLYTVATIYHNLASTCQDTNDPESALIHAAKAREYYERLGLATEKTDWIEGAALLTLGQADEAEAIFRRVRDAFYSRCLPEKAATVGLDIIEAMIVKGNLEGAIRLTEDVITDFVSTGMNHRLATALAYLKELLPTSSRPRAVLDHVRRYAVKSGTQPTLEFAALPEDFRN
jgi:tetratricopeptide (TPR) repeat protein